MTAPDRIFVRSLRFDGPSGPGGLIEFDRGLNVVVGPSDTGKSLLLECIDFALGRSSKVKQVPELRPFQSVTVGLELLSGPSLDLTRSLAGGVIQVTRDGRVEKYAQKHDDGNERNVSKLLLSLTGFVNQRVRQNARGTTRGLSFRDVVRHVIVDEEQVIKERSPALSGQYTMKTVDTAVFRLLLTGEDDSDVKEFAEPKVERGRRDGRREILNDLLREIRVDLEAAGGTIRSETSLEAELTESSQQITSLAERINQARTASAAVDAERRDVHVTVRQIESQVAVLEQLLERFHLLRAQYVSDHARLEAVAEASGLLARLPEEHCPVCGAAPEHHDRAHRDERSEPEAVAAAAAAEAAKIDVLVRDLDETTATTELRLVAERRDLEQERSALASLEGRARSGLVGVIEPLLAEQRRVEARNLELLRELELRRREVNFTERLAVAERAVGPPARLGSPTLPPTELSRFCEAVDTVLRPWGLESTDQVAFDPNTIDLVVGGRERGGHGKGVRALLHAAFTLGLVKYCTDFSLCHPGFAVIDSPLVVYRQPDTADPTPTPDVKDAFYRSVADQFREQQVIIVENEEPPDDLGPARVVRFTGASHGRFGLLPPLGASPAHQPVSLFDS